MIFKKLSAPGGLLAPEAELPPPLQTAASEINVLASNVLDHWLNTKTNSIYAINYLGQILKLSGDESELVSGQALNNLNSISVSPDGSKIIAKFNYPELPTFSMYDTISKIWKPLPKNVISAAWSPNSEQIAYLDNSGKSGKLAILTVSSNKTQEVAKMTQKNMDLAWIKPDEIIFYQPFYNESPSSMWAINISKKTVKSIFKDEIGLDIIWSKTDDLGLKLTNNAQAPKLSLIDKLGNALSDISFVTLPEKCSIEQMKIYCGVPQSKPAEGIILPDDFYKKSFYSKDDIYMIDLGSGNVNSLFNGDQMAVDVYHPIPENGKLLFINRFDNNLYSVKLP